MRIYTRQDFMKLPEGTIFAKGKPWYFEELSVKGETLAYDGVNSDFTCRSLCEVEAHNSDEHVENLDKMLHCGISVPLNEGYGRDCCYDEEDVFLVYEKNDLENVISVPSNAIEICTKE